MSHISGSITMKESNRDHLKEKKKFYIPTTLVYETTFMFKGAFSAICPLIVGDAVGVREK